MEAGDEARETAQRLVRNSGTTSAERYLQRLCERSFLSLWSYANIYRDQGTSNQQRTGKEVCDLLVVFGNHIVIFSDKYCAFPNSGKIELDWRRWFKRAVESAAHQVWGAERWIRTHPDRLFLDKECSTPFPINLPALEQATFHRIVVAHGASARCREFFGRGSSGSLVIDTSIVGPQHYSLVEGRHPFCIGQLDPSRGFVHVLDDTSLDIVLRTLDTVSDFVDYLQKKEGLLARPDFRLWAAGEEDLLAFFLRDTNEKDEHDFIVEPELRGAPIEEGHWNEFVTTPEYQAKKEADRISYAWDSLIEAYNRHILAETQYFASPGGAREQERIMRWLAREPRLHRRMLAKALLDLLEKSPPDIRATRIVVPHGPDEPYYIFLLLPQPDFASYEEYRLVRRNFLEICCRVLKYVYSDATDIVGIATEAGRGQNNPGGSEDAMYFDARNWTDELNEEARSLQQKLNLFNNLVPNPQPTELEYPVPGKLTFRVPENHPRNAPCPCGSGKKYKMCHGVQEQTRAQRPSPFRTRSRKRKR